MVILASKISFGLDIDTNFSQLALIQADAKRTQMVKIRILQLTLVVAT